MNERFPSQWMFVFHWIRDSKWNLFVVIAPQFFFHHSKVLITMFDQNELSFLMVGLSLNTSKANINLIMMN